MKKTDLYEIALKLLGLYLFFISLGLLRDVLSVAALMPQAKPITEASENFDLSLLFVLNIAHFIFVLLFASLLIFRTKAVVKLICKQTDYQEIVNLSADRKVIYETVLVVTGLLLIVWTLPDFAFKLKNYIQTSRNDLLILGFDKSFIASSVISIIIGLVAVLYAKPISALLTRNGKKDEKQAEPPIS